MGQFSRIIKAMKHNNTNSNAPMMDMDLAIFDSQTLSMTIKNAYAVMFYDLSYGDFLVDSIWMTIDEARDRAKEMSERTCIARYEGELVTTEVHQV